MNKPISGSKAAKLIGVGGNFMFKKRFVDTGQITPIIYEGGKRWLYDPEDVQRLLFLNKRTVTQPSITQEMVKEILKKHQRNYINE